MSSVDLDKAPKALSIAAKKAAAPKKPFSRKHVVSKAATDKAAAGKKKPAAKPATEAKTVVPLDTSSLPTKRELEKVFSPGNVRMMIRENCGKGKRFASQKIFAETVRIGMPALGKFLAHSDMLAGRDSYVYLHAGTWFMRDDPDRAEKRQNATKERGHPVGYKKCGGCGHYVNPKKKHWCLRL